MLDIKGIDKAVLLMFLWEGAHVVLPSSTPLSLERAVETTLDPGCDLVFGIVHGRLLSANLHGDAMDETAYDKTAGAGTAQRAIEAARSFMAEMEDSTKKVQQLVFVALNKWRSAYDIEPMLGALLLSMVLVLGPAKLQRMLATATSFTAMYAELSGFIVGGTYTAEGDALVTRQAMMLAVFQEALGLAMEIVPMTKQTGGALVMRGPIRPT